MPNYNIIETFRKAELEDRVREAVSRVGAGLKDKEGKSMYDAVSINQRDMARIDDFLTKSMRMIQSEMPDICSSVVASDEYTLRFFIPDFDTESRANLIEEATRFCTMSAVSDWLQMRAPEHAAVFAERAKTSIGRLSTIARTRITVSRI